MLLGPERSSEPGIVRRIEDPVGTNGVVSHMAGENDLVADRHAHKGHTRQCEGPRSRARRYFAKTLDDALEGQPAAKRNVFSERHEMMLGIAGHRAAPPGIGLDGVVVDGRCAVSLAVEDARQQRHARR